MTANYFAATYLENGIHLTNRERMNRSCTDIPHLIIFGVFFTVWIGIAIHAYSAGVPYDFSHLETHKDALAIEISVPLLYQCSILSASYIWLTILFLGLYFIAVRFYTKKLIYTTLFFMFAVLSAFLFFVIYSGHYAFLPILAVIVNVYGFTIYALKQVGSETLCSIVQKACRAMIDLPSTVIITIVQINLMLLIALFTISVLSNLTSIRTELKSTLINSADFRINQEITESPPAYVIAFTIIFLSCSLWMITLVYNFGRTALYGTFVTWHRTVDKNSIPRMISVRSMFTSFRYHFGTVTFASTIFTVFQILRATFSYWNELFGKFKSRPITIFCFLTLLANSTTNTLIACTSHGTSFYRSTKHSFKLIMQNPLKFTATHIITEWMIFFGMFLIFGLTLFSTVLYFVENNIYYLPPVPGLSIIIIGSVSFWIILVFLLTLRAAIATFLFCYLGGLSSSPIITNEDLLYKNIGDEIVTV